MYLQVSDLGEATEATAHHLAALLPRPTVAGAH